MDKLNNPLKLLENGQIRTCKITDYYEILSVQKDAEEVHIKKAYRKLALTLHPDKVCTPNDQ